MGGQLLASKIVIQEETPQVRSIAGVATNVTGFLGITEKGPVGVATFVASPDDYDRVFGGYVANGDVRQAIDGFFANGGTQAWVVRTVHYSDVTDPTTKTSAAASTTLQTGATGATGGVTSCTNSAPFNFEPNDTCKVITDGNGAGQTATFTAAAAARECANAATYNLTDGWTLTVQIDGGGTQTITFHTSNFSNIAAATAAEVAAVINAGLTGGSATASSGGTKVTITSDRRGTSSHVQVTGGTANGALGFVTTIVDGTGNVANIDAVTAAEFKTVVETAVTGVTVTGSTTVSITRNTTGTGATVQVDSSSTVDTIMGFDNAVHAGTTGAAVNTLTVAGKYDGTYANVLKAVIQNATSGEAARFNLLVQKSGVTVETWTNLTMDDNDANYVETIINADVIGSKYIKVTDLDAGTPAGPSGDRPTNVTSPFLTGGNDGLASIADVDFTGATSSGGKTGMRCFDLVQELNLLTVPARATSAVHNAMLTYCEVTRNMSMFAILDPPAGQSATDIVTYYGTTAAVLELSEFGAAYWPRIKVLNPNTAVFGKTSDGNITVAPSGHIAGVYARRDQKSLGGVYEPPAGVDDGVIFGCLGFDTDDCLQEEKNDLVFPKRINPLTRLKSGPRFVDGARTLKSSGNFPSVPERRGAIFIEQSVKDGLQFARQKSNDETLRGLCQRTVEDFLFRQMKNGAFRSKDPATAYFVDFDVAGTSLNVPSVQFAGQLIGRIGIATKKVAEYIVLRFSQDTRAFDEQNAA